MCFTDQLLIMLMPTQVLMLNQVLLAEEIKEKGPCPGKHKP